MRLLALLLAGSVARAAVVDRIAAVVNDEVVTLSELYELGGGFIEQRCGATSASAGGCVEEAELQVLDSLIFRSLVTQELEDLGLDVTDEELDRQIDDVMRGNQIEDRDLFARMIQQATGLSWDTYRDQMRQEIRAEKFRQIVIRPRVSVTDDEVKDLYNRSSRQVTAVPERTLEALAVQVPEDADELERHRIEQLLAKVAQRVNAGEMDWKEAVATYDSGLYAPVGGDMGTYTRDDLTEVFRQPVFDTLEGQVGAPIQVGQAVYLVKVVKVSAAGGVLPFAEAAPQIRQQLYQQKIELEQEQWYLQARRRSAVRILL